MQRAQWAQRAHLAQGGPAAVGAKAHQSAPNPFHVRRTTLLLLPENVHESPVFHDKNSVRCPIKDFVESGSRYSLSLFGLILNPFRHD